MELPRVRPADPPVDRVQDEPEWTVVLEELASEEPQQSRPALHDPHAVQDHEVVPDEPRVERPPVDDDRDRHNRARCRQDASALGAGDGRPDHAPGFRHATW